MPLDTCIANVGEYYSSHYLDSTFARDVKALESRWQDEGSQAVPRRLQALSQRYFRAKTQALDEEDPALRAKAGEEVAGRRLYENLEVVYQVANVCPILLSTGNPSFDSSSLRLSERAIIGNHIRVRRIGAVWHGESSRALLTLTEAYCQRSAMDAQRDSEWICRGVLAPGPLRD